MSGRDPKSIAQERFADPEPLATGISVIDRCATDPPLVLQGLVDAVRERAPSGGRVAELGFGSGWLIEELCAQVRGVSVFGLDMSPGQVERAYGLYGDRVGFVVGDIEQLPCRHASFDVIVTCWTLYFMRDIDAALDEIVRCLTHRGRLVVGASAPDHEIECEELVRAATRMALGRDVDDSDVGGRFDLETGGAYLRRHFRGVEIRHWRGELVLSDLADVLSLWPKWQPASLTKGETQLVREVFGRLAAERIARDGALRARRRNGAFVCDLEP